MIEYITGDLMTAPESLIVHGCNAQGKMGKGVAKLIRDKWPEVFEEYERVHSVMGLELGEVVYVETADKDKVVANAITQDNYRKTYDSDTALYVDYDAIKSCFEDIAARCKLADVSELAMPKIGAGLGGGDWDRIAGIIDQVMPEFQVKVYCV